MIIMKAFSVHQFFSCCAHTPTGNWSEKFVPHISHSNLKKQRERSGRKWNHAYDGQAIKPLKTGKVKEDRHI